MIQLLLRQAPSPQSLAAQSADFTADGSLPVMQPFDAGARAGFMSQLALAALLALPLMASAADRAAPGSFEAGVHGSDHGFRQQARAADAGRHADAKWRHQKSEEIFDNQPDRLQGSGDRWAPGAFADPGGPELGLPTLAVPEPGTYALMLAGLAAVAWLVRRRSRE